MTARDNDDLSGMAAVAGLALAGTVALPITGGGPSILQGILEAFGDGWVDGVLMLLLFGAPYLLGLFVAVAAARKSPRSALLLRVPITILYGELVLLALFLLKDQNDAVAPWSLIGFVAVATLRAVAHTGRGAAGVVWTARWGAMLVAGLFAWVLLQAMSHGASLISPWATFGAALLVAASCRPRRAQ